MHHRIASAGLSVAVLFGATAFAQDPLHLWQAPEYWSPSLATIGDTNGDGGSELAIGGFSLSGHPPGFVHLRSGITGAILKSFSDTTPESYFGEAMAAAGDVDQDGAPDLVVGAWGRDDNGVDSGRVFVFSSASSGPAAPLFAIDGGPGDALGYGVSGGVDFDGDGVPDFAATAQIVVSSPASPYLRAWSGATGSPLLTWTSTSSNELWAGSFDLIGDVDLDGFGDLALGSYTFGGASPGHVDILSSATGARIHQSNGAAPSDAFGFRVVRAGDVDLDGFGDVFASSHTFNGNVGYVRAISGATGQVLHQWSGQHSSENFGYSIAAAGDVDDDGHADLVVGAPFDELPGQVLHDDRGTLSVFSGRTSQRLYYVGGPNAGGSLGFAVAGGDLDGVGLGEFVGGGLASPVVAYPDCPDLTEEYGVGCAGAGGFVPALLAAGCTRSGGAIAIGVAGALGHTSGLFLLGVGQAAQPLPGGCSLLVGALLPLTVPLTFGGAGPGAGVVHMGAALPNIVATTTLTVQCLVIDPMVARGYSASNAVLITLAP